MKNGVFQAMMEGILRTTHPCALLIRHVIVNIQNSGPVGLDYTSHDGVVFSQLLLSVVSSPTFANAAALRSLWRSIPILIKVKMEIRSLETSKGSMSRANILLVWRRPRQQRAFNHQLNY